MSGRVVSVGRVKHECAPGWRTEATTEAQPATPEWPAVPEGFARAIPPTPWDYPKGTVWECDCGRRWVSRGSVYLNTPGEVFWRRESVLPRLGRALHNVWLTIRQLTR